VHEKVFYICRFNGGYQRPQAPIFFLLSAAVIQRKRGLSRSHNRTFEIEVFSDDNNPDASLWVIDSLAELGGEMATSQRFLDALVTSQRAPELADADNLFHRIDARLRNESSKGDPWRLGFHSRHDQGTPSPSPVLTEAGQRAQPWQTRQTYGNRRPDFRLGVAGSRTR